MGTDTVGCRQKKKTGDNAFAGLEDEITGDALPAEITTGKFRSGNAFGRLNGNIALNV